MVLNGLVIIGNVCIKMLGMGLGELDFFIHNDLLLDFNVKVLDESYEGIL